MMKRIGIAIIMCGMLLGCASSQWVKPGASQADLAHDKAQCHYEGLKSVAGSSETITAFDQIGVENACMRAKGWR
jgi:hypothetical protein